LAERRVQRHLRSDRRQSPGPYADLEQHILGGSDDASIWTRMLILSNVFANILKTTRQLRFAHHPPVDGGIGALHCAQLLSTATTRCSQTMDSSHSKQHHRRQPLRRSISWTNKRPTHRRL
jgi:hypothetical protein